MITARRTLVVLLVLSFLTVSGTAQAQRIFGVTWEEGLVDPGSIVEFDPNGGGGMRLILPVTIGIPNAGPFLITGGLSYDGSSLYYGSTLAEEGGASLVSTLVEIDPDTGDLLDEDIVPDIGAITGLASLNGLLYISHVIPGPDISHIEVFDPVADTLVDSLDIAATNPGIVGVLTLGGAQSRGTLSAVVDLGELEGAFAEIDPATGIATLIGPFGPSDLEDYPMGMGAVEGDIYFSGLDYEPDTWFIGRIGFDGTGETIMPTNPVIFSDIAAGPGEPNITHAIPEPATLALLGLGLAALAQRRRRT